MDKRDTDPTAGGFNWGCIFALAFCLLVWAAFLVLIVRVFR